MANKQLRLQHFLVQPVLLIDDGETLTPGPNVEVQAVTLSELQELVASWPDRLAKVAEQVLTAEP